ncbi:hypothetical protein IMZ68_07050, partial [Candidatus Bathyarchaeota archaeon]|nr:hypothetical protein [Candidatus Bathyarchaeota archaeon]
KVQLEYRISGDALPGSKRFIEISLSKLGKDIARFSIGEVPHLAANDLKQDGDIYEVLSKIQVDDPNFKDLEPITDEDVFEIGSLAIAKAEAAKESLTSPKAKAKLTGFEEKIAQGINKLLN